MIVALQVFVDLGDVQVNEHTGDLGSLFVIRELLDKVENGGTNGVLVVRVLSNDGLDEIGASHRVGFLLRRRLRQHRLNLYLPHRHWHRLHQLLQLLYLLHWLLHRLYLLHWLLHRLYLLHCLLHHRLKLPIPFVFHLVPYRLFLFELCLYLKLVIRRLRLHLQILLIQLLLHLHLLLQLRLVGLLLRLLLLLLGHPQRTFWVKPAAHVQRVLPELALVDGTFIVCAYFLFFVLAFGLGLEYELPPKWVTEMVMKLASAWILRFFSDFTLIRRTQWNLAIIDFVHFAL